MQLQRPLPQTVRKRCWKSNRSYSCIVDGFLWSRRDTSSWSVHQQSVWLSRQQQTSRTVNSCSDVTDDRKHRHRHFHDRPTWPPSNSRAFAPVYPCLLFARWFKCSSLCSMSVMGRICQLGPGCYWMTQLLVCGITAQYYCNWSSFGIIFTFPPMQWY